jgi:fatty acid desaturase
MAIGIRDHGYRAEGWLRAELPSLQQTSLPITVAWALGDHLSIALCGLIVVVVASVSTLGGIGAAVALAVVAARQMRGLECLVHEGSHRNWLRANREFNDRLTNLLAAWPVLSDVAGYRATHMVHHKLLGSEEDTDLLRWRRLRLDQLNREQGLAFAVGLARRLPSYIVSWWWAIRVDGKTIQRFLVWHAAYVTLATLLGGFLVGSWVIGGLIWIFAWLLPFAVVLPVIRFLGEIEEHRYDGVGSIISATYTNVGFVQRALLHPHGDAYHTFHHLFPAVPFFRVGRVHRRLMADDLGGYRRLVTERRSVRDAAPKATSENGD